MCKGVGVVFQGNGFLKVEKDCSTGSQPPPPRISATLLPQHSLMDKANEITGQELLATSERHLVPTSAVPQAGISATPPLLVSLPSPPCHCAEREGRGGLVSVQERPEYVLLGACPSFLRKCPSLV